MKKKIMADNGNKSSFNVRFLSVCENVDKLTGVGVRVRVRVDQQLFLVLHYYMDEDQIRNIHMCN